MSLLLFAKMFELPDIGISMLNVGGEPVCWITPLSVILVLIVGTGVIS
jgi:hypothetical protein